VQVLRGGHANAVTALHTLPPFERYLLSGDEAGVAVTWGSA
jgi:hypothetical protein